MLGHGVGSYVIADSSYAPLAHVNAGNGMQRRSPRVPADRPRHGAAHDLPRDAPRPARPSEAPRTARSRTRSSRRSTSRPGACCSSGTASTTSRSPSPTGRSGNDWDYVHLNSIGVDPDGNLLVSSRNTHTIYKIDRSSGQIIWRLGGKHSDFDARPRGGVRLAARRAAPARRLDQPLRQRRARVPRAAAERRRGAAARHAAPRLHAPGAALLHQPGQRADARRTATSSSAGARSPTYRSSRPTAR